MTDQPVGDFPRTLFLDVAFASEVGPRAIDTITVKMTGANDDQPVEATFSIGSTWQAQLGFRPATPVRTLAVSIAAVEVPSGQIYDLAAAVSESIGTIPRSFGPGDSVGELCGGFGDPF